MAILGGESWPDWVLWPGAAVAVAFLVRSLAVAVIFHDGGIVIRNVFHTYRIARSEVAGLGGGWYHVFLLKGEVGAAEVRTYRERIPRRWGPASWATSPFNLMDFFGTPRPLLKVGIAASVLRSKRQRQRFVQDFNTAASKYGYVSGLAEPDLNRFF